MSAKVHLIGVSMIRFGKYPDRGVKELTAETLAGVLEDAGVGKEAIQAAWFSNSAWGMNGGQDCIRGQVALRPSGIEGIPITNVENACAGGATAFHGAWLGVTSGLYDVALAIGVEKLFVPGNKMRMFASFLSGLDVGDLAANYEKMREIESRISIRATPPAGPDGGRGAGGAKTARPARSIAARVSSLREEIAGLPQLVRNLIVLSDKYGPQVLKLGAASGKRADHSPFMDIYSLMARFHMERYGTTQKQIAAVAAKNHGHGALNPFAQIRRAMTVEEVLADRMVSFPLTRSMCAPIGDGAAAAIVCSEAFLKKIGHARPVLVRASVLGSGTNRPFEGEDIAERLARQAYERAGVGPGDLDLAEVHDASAFAELHQVEMLGLCKEGEGGAFVETGATALGGKIPLNTSGGLECRGHPIGATGLAQIHEVVTQLRGEAGERQVAGARIGLTQNGGGNVGNEEAAMAIHVFESTGRGEARGGRSGGKAGGARRSAAGVEGRS